MDFTAAGEAELQRYRSRTPASAAAFGAAAMVLPGGDSRSTLHHEPYPVHLVRAAGARLWDADGNEYLDFTNNHTALVHGNAFPPVLKAARQQMDQGLCFGTPTPLQGQAAHLLVERVPSLDLVRFCASGTEATMHATRVARAFTGRHLIAKAEGAYHGSQDDMFISTHPSPETAGPADHPLPTPRCPGLGRSSITDTIVLPFNDPAASARLIRSAGDDLAAVFVEPVMGSAGMIPAEPAYLLAIAQAAADVGALLVFDEVITLRLSTSGGQGWFGIKPDLSCFGKMLGGGFPLGAFGGRRDIMELFDPTRPDAVAHPGSMNAHPVSLAAAMTTLDELTVERIDQMNLLGGVLADRLSGVAECHGMPLTVTGLGSLRGLHFTHEPVRRFRDTWDEDRQLGQTVFLGLLNEGVLIDRRGAVCLSTQTQLEDVEGFAAALDRVLHRATRV